MLDMAKKAIKNINNRTYIINFELIIYVHTNSKIIAKVKDCEITIICFESDYLKIVEFIDNQNSYIPIGYSYCYIRVSDTLLKKREDLNANS